MSMSKNKSMKKMHRVSRLINDIRSSSKHNDSLVVQTGFPTSLIDLFVKHRDRFNRSSSSTIIKKHNKNPSPPPPLVEEIRSTPNPLPPPTHHPLVDSVSESNSYAIDASSEKSRVVFMNVVKIFVILSFAFVTKRLAISVTFWAFLLLFLEYWFKSHRNRHIKAEIGVEEEEASICSCSQGSVSLIDEKEVLQFVQEDQIEECKLSESDENSERCVEEPLVEFVRLSGSNKMCRAKLRAKQFRKLVANKFRTNGGIEAKEQSLVAPVR